MECLKLFLGQREWVGAGLDLSTGWETQALGLGEHLKDSFVNSFSVAQCTPVQSEMPSKEKMEIFPTSEYAGD